MSLTLVGTIFAAATGTIHCVLRIRRHGSISPQGVFVVTGAAFSIPTGMALIVAALIGDPSSLPPDWQVYITAGGLVTVGLSVQYLFKAFRTIGVGPTLD